MDEDTQILIERTRQRREMLNQRIVGMPEAAPRKRRTPVLEADGSERVLSEKQMNDDDSPKRQCLREEEQILKPDTPAIKGVQSRAAELRSSRTVFGEENKVEDLPVPVPRKSISSPPLERKNISPSKSPTKGLTAATPSRKNRFAALAQNINQWEDDLTHVIHKEEKKKPRWQPPSMKTSEPDLKPAVSCEKKTIPAPTSSLTSKTTEVLSSPKKTHAPPTPRNVMPSKSAASTSSTTALARNSPLRSSKVCTPALSASTPAVASAVSSNVKSSVSRPKECDPSELPVSQRMSQMQEKLANVTPRTRSKADEPTAYSVGARMSAWENMSSSNMVSDIKKVNPGEATPTTRGKPVTGSARAVNATDTPKNPPPPPSAKKGVTPGKSFKESIEEKAALVWSKKSMNNANSSPVKSTPTGVQSPSKTGAALVHSPTKVSVGTKVVQQRLIECGQSTTCGSMAAESRANRLAELEALQNRWKDGVLKNDLPTSNDTVQNDAPAPKVGSTSPKKVSEPKTRAEEKKLDARNRARAEFDNKLAEIGLGKEPSTPSTVPSLPKAVSASKSTPAKSGSRTTSIYNLIKKQEGAADKATEKKATPQKVKFNDSFDDSDDESQCKVPRSAALRAAKQTSVEIDADEFKKPLSPQIKVTERDRDMPSTSDAPSSSDAGDEDFDSNDRLSMEIDDDDISLKGFVSEAVRRESILPGPGQRRPSSQSSLDSYDESRTVASESSSSEQATASSKEGGYQRDDEDMGDEDSDNDRDAIDDFLDEAMSDEDPDSEMDPKNVILRKNRPEMMSRGDYDPDMDVNNVVLRRKPQANSAAPVPTRRSHGRSMDSSDEDDSRPYSLQAYRKSANVHQHMMEPVIRSSKYVGKNVRDETIEMPVARPRKDDRRAVQERIKELQDLVHQEQNVIMQTSNALNKCCLGNSYFAGSAEQVECNRLLLISCQKRQCYMTEIQRLKDTNILSPEGPGPQGSLTISDIRLPLKKDFVTKIGTSNDTMTHYFILLIRNGCQLICTQMLSTHDPMMRGSLDFPNLIKINGITGNFKLTVDLYTMSVCKEMLSKDKKKKTPKKVKGYAMSMESPGGPRAVRTTSFSHVSSLILTMKTLDKTSFNLDRLPYLSPLYGQIFLRQKCLMESNVEERGFLTMFDDVSGFGSWHRRWCVLSGNKLCVWKYPDDETRKDPMTMIDLKKCVSEKVGLIPRDICARPNTFEMVTVRQPHKGENDTLVTRTYNTMTTVRHQISADSKEERIVWCNKINRTLANLRTWNADALKPIKESYQQ